MNTSKSPSGKSVFARLDFPRSANAIPSGSFGGRGLVAAALIALLCVLGVGCKISSHNGYSSIYVGFEPGAANYATNYLQEGDVVSITFQYSTNFNTTQKITLDGTVNLESVGVVRAAGKTSLQLQGELENLYRTRTKDDPITVKVLAAVNSVYVSGAVFHPGKILLERPMTALEAIMEAGGFDAGRANLADVSVLRVVADRQVKYRLNLKRVIQGANEAPFYLKPYDIVHVPMKAFNF